MFLIDNDEAEIAIGQEQGRARADHHLGIAAQNGAPGQAPLEARQLRMPLAGRRTEALGETFQPLRGERDLRQQDQCLLPALQARGDRFKINFRFARSGDTVEQRDAGMGLDEFVGGGALRVGKLRAGQIGIGLAEGFRQRLRDDAQLPELRHLAQHA